MLKLNHFGARLSAFAVSFFTTMMAAAAYANDIDSIVDDAGQQLVDVGDLVNIVSYGGGAVLAATGLLNTKKHIDNPSQNELRKGIGPMAVGVGLLAFPTFAGYLDNSLLSGQAANAQYDNNAFQASF